ncbi:unnamed protein product [Fraxinus pennsylvanica]|uniref:Uncharacterized protein n=1 Tax=Fraxinus pennsylvanica TaxID=56036 RepID=A0AAD2E4F0_9LAMI|nr:unnamed protein product [Fraxinus pennsylvanica]
MYKSVPENFEVGNTGSCETISSRNLIISSLKNSVQEPMPSGNFMDTELPPDQEENSVSKIKLSSSLLKPIMTEPAIFTGSVGQAADCFELSQQSTSSITEVVSYCNVNCREPQLQILHANHYLHGEFAASASARVSLQVASKRGCLLNVAASNATKGAMKALAGLRSAKKGEGSLPGISAYVMFMEESLGGLVVGPFLNDAFRKRWRKQIEHATTYNAVKTLLLELEENIRTIALSGDWVKLVEGCSTESSASQSAASAAGSTQKRRPRRRGRKPSAMAEVAIDCQDLLSDFTWWRGGTLSKCIFQRGILPRSMIKNAARQGGSKTIPGIHYVEGRETPKRSRQLLWRSAVEMIKNASQLALQVRYLDFHVRWIDLVRPEQIPFDGKGLETEASAFKNAFICGLCQEQCVNSSTVLVNEEVELLITCKQCYQIRALTRTEICNASPRSPLLQGRDVLNTATTNKREKQASIMGHLHRSELCSVFLRLKNILLKGNPHMDLTRPDCRLCSQPYNSDLISPICPYLPPEKKVALEKKMMKKVPKQEISGMDSDSIIIFAQGKEEALHVPADDPLFCHSGVEQLTEE